LASETDPAAALQAAAATSPKPLSLLMREWPPRAEPIWRLGGISETLSPRVPRGALDALARFSAASGPTASRFPGRPSRTFGPCGIR
jgi:hypothetical protein